MPENTARVSYVSATETITITPDPLPVDPGSHTLTWEPEAPSTDWFFNGLQIDTPNRCFSDKNVQKEVITVLDKNEGPGCHGLFKYSLSVFDTVKGKTVTTDPEIENKPGG